ncbi:MAG: hypothetical protein WDN23_15080 [Edaphobacter sp.]
MAAYELRAGRKIDLVAAPSGTVICIDGRKHTDFESLMPIECKRLPTPSGNDRDEREYVISRFSTTGGIQRFKTGQHGAMHRMGGMIAYVQQNTRNFWQEQVKQWIEGLIADGQAGWTSGDLLNLLTDDALQRLATLSSTHTRTNSSGNIELRHLWVSMN